MASPVVDLSPAVETSPCPGGYHVTRPDGVVLSGVWVFADALSRAWALAQAQAFASRAGGRVTLAPDPPDPDPARVPAIRPD